MRSAAALLLLAVVSDACADEIIKHRGRCQSLTILDRPASLRCADEIVVQRDALGQRGIIVRTDDAVLLFVLSMRQPMQTACETYR